MKVLIVGGACQGKRAYAERAYGPVTLDQLHLEAHRRMEREEPVSSLPEELDRLGNWTVLCDEVGSGVIPVDAFDREWREAVGRLCCDLAARADIVERVCCGIPLRLKGGVGGGR